MPAKALIKFGKRQYWPNIASGGAGNGRRIVNKLVLFLKGRNAPFSTAVLWGTASSVLDWVGDKSYGLCASGRLGVYLGGDEEGEREPWIQTTGKFPDLLSQREISGLVQSPTFSPGASLPGSSISARC